MDAATLNVYQNFDSMTPTVGTATEPGNGGTWHYDDWNTNVSGYYNQDLETAGWYNTASDPSPNTNVHEFFGMYNNNADNTHIGFTAYTYLDIDNTVAINGNSLRITCTGGYNEYSSVTSGYGACVNGCGSSVLSKRDYETFINESINPVYTGGYIVGAPYIYFISNVFSQDQGGNVSIVEAQNTNRLSLYIHIPSTMNNGTGGSGNPPNWTMMIGPFLNNAGTTQGHFYHYYMNEGGTSGSWVHLLADGHPQWNNGWNSASDSPCPSGSVRNMNVAGGSGGLFSPYSCSTYSSTLTNGYQDIIDGWYVEVEPYDGVGIPPFQVWLDEIEFFDDDSVEPQNNETINSPAITYYDGVTKGLFAISLDDKYINNQYSYSTYQIKYSFSQITNANFASATPCQITADSRYGVTANTSGLFAKWWPYYQAVYAPFTLQSGDIAKLTPGTVVYFAILDVSQGTGSGGNSQTPWTSCGVGNWSTCGRAYSTESSTFDYTADSVALPYIKRISFQIPNPGSGSGSSQVAARTGKLSNGGQLK
jgi:hypothetical protein